MNLRGKTVLVLGMGETGFSMAKWLSHLGANVRAADSRAAPPCMAALRQALPVTETFAGAFTAEAFTGMDAIAISPGVPLAEPLVQRAVKNGVPVVGDIELFALAIRRLGISKPKILAVTGSNGKTTVTAMAGAMAEKAGWDVEVAGNIGPAVLDTLMRREDSGKLPQAWVLEVSSFQLETTQNLDPDAAAVLNLSEDHFDRYAGIRDYAAAKARIFLRGAHAADGGDGGDGVPPRRAELAGLDGCRHLPHVRPVRRRAPAGDDPRLRGADPALCLAGQQHRHTCTQL
ncbi:MAG: UDP-N-acetylmuramoyl-L-alanine--D-glutamate ligase, partial [Nitrosospira sp.]|nr:UDP-N-acetylmuramoyl-L-alanine--D-glutamate ligase [Nitrosospira sp.]